MFNRTAYRLGSIGRNLLIGQSINSNQFPTRYYSIMTSAHIKKQYDDIHKSEEDKRFYRGLELNNGMKILLISDPTTDKSSAALDVNIGSMSDPWEFLGLAHFCEHMLFLGTKKYPEENEYNKFLSEHGGMSNAFTSGEHTNFYFDVAPHALEGALDRFAQFFLSPLFTASATEREVNAVDSENDKNLQNDIWRMFQLEKHTCNNKHDFSKFGTGNKTTLLNEPKDRGEDTRDALLAFHDKYYSSNLMALSVLGKESLDELVEMVVPKLCDVENKNVSVPEWLEHPCGADQLKLECHLVPVKDIRQLNVTWPIMDLHPFYKTNPGHYLGHLIGHEGPGSLLSELKSRGWVNTLIGGQKSGANGFMFFIVNVDLSEEGIEHTDDIILLIFQYLNLLNKVGPQEWIFRECQDLSVMSFRFKDKEQPRNYTCSIAGALHDYSLEEVLCGGYMINDWKPELINNVMEKLTPDNMRIMIVGKQFEGQTDKKEKWYDTDYSLCDIASERIERFRNAGLNDKLSLPQPNEFIPTNFNIVPRETETTPFPSMIRDTPMTKIWFKQDDKYLMPKAYVNVEFISPYAYMDPLCTNLTYLFVALFRDALTEYSYAAELAGLGYLLQSTIYGLTLALSGYNDKQYILLKKILEKMTTFKIDPRRFEILKENYERGLKNFKAEQPHQHAVYYTSTMMSEQVWTKDELLDAVDEMTVEKLEAFITQILSRMHLELLVYGNVTKEGAMSFADAIEETLSKQSGTKPLLPSQQRRFREVQLPDGCCYVYKRSNDVHKSSSLEVYYQCTIQQTDANMILELFCQIISEPCFDILRTQEQLGYIVFSGVRRSNGVQGLRVIVQSDKTPAYVEQRVEAFLHKMESHIESLTEEQFKNHVEALANKRLEEPKKMSTQNMKYWSEIISQLYNFDRDNIEVAHLRTLTKADVLGFYKELLAHDAPKRHKFSVHIMSSVNGLVDETVPDNNDNELPPLREMEEIINVSQFKRQLPLFPLPVPYGHHTNNTKSKL